MMPPESAATPPRRHVWLVALGLAVLAALPYISSMAGPWLLDDVPLIARNPYVQRPGLWWRLWTDDYWSSTGATSGLYRPLPMMSYALTWGLFGDWTPVYHATNVLLHAACVVLLFVGLTRFAAHAAAAVAAALFALHPVHAEAVANIAGRTELLLAAGLLTALHGIGAFDGGRRVAGAGLAVLGTACMVFSKETGLALAVLVLGLLVWRGLAASGAARIAALATAGSVAAVGVIHVAMRLAFAGSKTLAERPADTLNWLLLSLSAAGKNVQLLLLPWHQQAVWPLPGPEGPPVAFLVLGIAIGAALLTGLVLLGRLGTLARLSLLVMMLSGLPLLHVVPNVIWVWERGLYVPALALAGLICAAVNGIRGDAARRFALGAVVLAAFIGGVRAGAMSRLYADDLRFHEYQWRPNPQDAGAALGLSESLRRRGRTDEAVQLRLTAYALAPLRGPVVMAVSGFLVEAGRTAEATRILESAAVVQLEFHTPAQAAQGYQVLSDLAGRVGLEKSSHAFSARARGQQP